MPFYDNDDGVLATDTVAARKIIMKVVISDGIEYALNLNYRTIDIESTDYTNIAAIVVTMTDLPRVYQDIEDLGFAIPIFVAIEYGDVVPDEWLPNVYGVLELADDQKFYNGQLVNAAAADYIATLDPPFFKP